jgi:hypothetical protein|tara:strand:+ start:5883 stop:5984 length:102 start_codon:yes stop_codon:yes gene_type:complete
MKVELKNYEIIKKSEKLENQTFTDEQPPTQTDL